MYTEGELMYPDLQEVGLCFALEEDYQDHHHLLVKLLEEEEPPHRLLDKNNIDFGSNGDTIPDGQYYYNYNNTHTYLSDDTSPVSATARAPSVTEYGLGAEGDLFKAPEPVIVESEDPLPATTDHHQPTATTALETMGNDLMSDVFYDDRMDFLEKTPIEETFPELADLKFPTLDMDDGDQSPMQKSISCGCLSTNEWSNEAPQRPGALDFQAVDYGAAFGLRRAFSEGDIETLGSGNAAVANASFLRPTYDRFRNVDDVKMEERRQKLSRYRKKRTKRNFDRKIKYACRKALADNQPRVRGRFARTEGCEVGKTSK